jgi:hypothetical protein
VNEINFVEEISKNLNGTFIDSLNSIKWTPYPKEVVTTSEDGFAYTSIDSVISYSSNNESFKLAVLSTNLVYEGFIYECASCSPSLGLALYKLIDGKFVLSSFNRSILRIGQGGHLPYYSIMDLSQNSKGFLISEDNFMDSDVYSYLFSISETQVSDLLFEYPNFRMTDRESSKYQTTTLSFIKQKKESEELYDLKLDITLFELDKKIGSESISYSFNGRKWETIK